MHKPSRRQQATLQLLTAFVPSWVNWNDRDIRSYAFEVAIPQSAKGEDAHTAFFKKTERGIAPTQLTNSTQYAQLLWGQRWMAAHVKMWKEGLREGTLKLFELEPEYQKLVC